MVRISTVYDKDLKQKVFMVRGDESYARTTDVSLTLGTITTGDIKGLKIATITINLYRTRGASSIVLYDGDEILHMQNINQGTSTVTLSNIYLSYGLDHNLWVEYKGNSSCLSSKSKITTVNKPIPSNLTAVITRNESTSQLTTGANIPINCTVTVNGSNVSNGTVVSIYIDGELNTTATTTSGVASTSISGISDGKHTVRLDVASGSGMLGNSLSYDVMIGYKVSIIQYPSPFVTGINNTFKTKVLNYNNSPVSSASVTMNSSSQSTNSSGIATHTISSYSGTTITATCNGNTSPSVTLDKFTPSSIAITYDYGTLMATATVSGTGTSTNVPLTFSIGGTSNTYYTSTGGTVSKKITATGTLTVTCGSVSKTFSISDVICSWSYGTNTRFTYTATGSVTEYPLYIGFGENSRITLTSPNTTSERIVNFTVASDNYAQNTFVLIGVGGNVMGVAFNEETDYQAVITNNSLTLYLAGSSTPINQVTLDNPTDLNPVIGTAIGTTPIKIYSIEVKR